MTDPAMFYTPAQVADEFKVSVMTIMRGIRSGAIRFHKLGENDGPENYLLLEQDVKALRIAVAVELERAGEAS